MSRMPRLGLRSVASLATTVVAITAVALVAPAFGQTEPPAAGVSAPVEPVPAAGAPATIGDAPGTPPPGPPPSYVPPAGSVATDPGALPPLGPPAPKPPLYEQPWFWGLVGVVVITAAIVTIGLATQGPARPDTDLGNKRAF
jgi:hypothetical protein